MPQLRVPPGFALAHYRFSVTGDPEVMSTQVGWEILDAVDADLLATDLGLAFSAAGGWGLDYMFSQWTFRGVHVRLGNDGPPLIGDYDPVAPGTVSTVGTPPQNCAVLIKKTTGFGGQKYRGRCYLPPIALAESAINNVGVIDAGIRTDLQTHTDDWIGYTQATYSTIVGDPVLLHTSLTDPTPITAFSVEAQIATQRRRLR